MSEFPIDEETGFLKLICPECKGDEWRILYDRSQWSIVCRECEYKGTYYWLNDVLKNIELEAITDTATPYLVSDSLTEEEFQEQEKLGR